jgi:hypothetical protein
MVEEASTVSCSPRAGSIIPATTATLPMTRLLELDEGVLGLLAEPLPTGLIA